MALNSSFIITGTQFLDNQMSGLFISNNLGRLLRSNVFSGNGGNAELAGENQFQNKRGKSGMHAINSEVYFSGTTSFVENMQGGMNVQKCS